MKILQITADLVGGKSLSIDLAPLVQYFDSLSPDEANIFSQHAAQFIHEIFEILCRLNPERGECYFQALLLVLKHARIDDAIVNPFL